MDSYTFQYIPCIHSGYDYSYECIILFMLKDIYCATFFGHPHLVAVAEVAVVGLRSLVLVFDSIRILVACGGTILCMGGPES